MPGGLITIPPLAADWISKLWKRFVDLRASRRQELQELTNIFGNPELLAPVYIEPDCQRTNPADHHEDEALRTFRQEIRKYLNAFLAGEFLERDGRNTLFVLSDAGMGKSSLLMMLKLSHMMSFWPSELDFRLLKLGAGTLETLTSLERRNKTVLLLDALDEDLLAWGQIEERLRELLALGKTFRQVIITCRTQFFPKGGRTPVESPERIEIAGYVCNMIYLAPFNEAQVEAYLQKRFPNKVGDRVRKLFTQEDNRRLVDARRLIALMRSLRMRPMLLAYVDVLLEARIEEQNEFSIYRALIDRWLLREETKPEGGVKRQDLWEACMTVAMHLQQTGQRNLTREALEDLVSDHPVARQIRTIDVRGRSLLNVDSAGNYRFSHYSIQEFLVAHRLITGAGAVSGVSLRATDQLLRFLYAWVRQDPRQRLEGIPWSRLDCEGLKTLDIDLSGLDLRNLKLPTFLRGFNLSNADLRGCDLHGVDFTATLLEQARLDPLVRLGVEFVLVPGGEFTLGTNEDLEAYDMDDRSWPKPEHSVRLSMFWISKTPITNAQYGEFLAASSKQEKPQHWGEEGFNHPQQPVVGVSWLDAMAYCRWAGFALPTEAQWEAAARGRDCRPYPWGKAKPTPELANYADSKAGRPTPVGALLKGAGPYGTLDQVGNVWEWCRDGFDPTAYRNRDGQLDPWVPGEDDQDSDSVRVLRGGGWADPAQHLPSAFRDWHRAWIRYRRVGFRVVSGLGPEHGF